ncbi:MAG: hypothetical protein Q8M65_03155 [Rhodoglobus sp.]|nr:hypothetical protein [Rhodoglobus sp.]
MIRGITRLFGSGGMTRLGYFGGTVVLNGLMSLISIPIVVAVVGADSWASMATGQSIGASLAALVLFGWGLTGPATVAMTSPKGRPQLYLDSLTARAVLLLPSLALQAGVTLAVAPSDKLVAVVSGTAMLLAGASANWYFTGAGRSGLFLTLDTVPRVAGTIGGLIAVVATGNLLFFALAQLVGSIFALAASAAVILARHPLDYRSALQWPRIRASLVQQRHGILATGLNAAFTPAALGVVALLAPATLPVFVLANRLIGFIGMSLSPIFMLFQGWVPAASGQERVRRLGIAGVVSAAAAVFSGVLCAALLPTFGVLLTHGEVVVSVSLAIVFGILAIVQTGSPFLSAVGLMAVGKVRTIARSTAVGVPLAIILLAIAELVGTTELAVGGLIVGGGVIAAWQIFAIHRAIREMPPEALSQLDQLDPIGQPRCLNPGINPAERGGVTSVQPATR